MELIRPYQLLVYGDINLLNKTVNSKNTKTEPGKQLV